MIIPSFLLQRLNHLSAPLFPITQVSNETLADHLGETRGGNLGDLILDDWIDGILILTEDGRCVESNRLGREICDRIAQDYPCKDHLPTEVWEVCRILIQSRQHFPNHLGVAESEVKLRNSYNYFRMRAQWIRLGHTPDPHILIILENQTHSKQNLAITEAIKYGFSPREADVWELHRIGYSYQEISARLHIAINTVKKHMKNTYAKQNPNSPLKAAYQEKLAS